MLFFLSPVIVTILILGLLELLPLLVRGDSLPSVELDIEERPVLLRPGLGLPDDVEVRVDLTERVDLMPKSAPEGEASVFLADIVLRKFVSGNCSG